MIISSVQIGIVCRLNMHTEFIKSKVMCLILLHMISKEADKPVHQHSLISSLFLASLKCTTDKLAACKISIF